MEVIVVDRFFNEYNLYVIATVIQWVIVFLIFLFGLVTSYRGYLQLQHPIPVTSAPPEVAYFEMIGITILAVLVALALQYIKKGSL